MEEDEKDGFWFNSEIGVKHRSLHVTDQLVMLMSVLFLFFVSSIAMNWLKAKLPKFCTIPSQ